MTQEQLELLEQARSTLDAAKLLLKNGHLRDAISRAYYSMFYVAEAFLGEANSRHSHKAVIISFGRDIAHTGQVPIEFHRKLIDAERLRNKADYRHREIVTPEEAFKQVADAEQFLQLGYSRIAQDV